MFYETAKNDHGLARNPLKAIVAPRPIGWITSMSAKGEINLAPYSFFNAVSDDPPMVLFSSEGPKDSLVFVEETKEFVCNLATFDLRSAVVETSGQFPRGVNEMDQCGLAPAPSRLVRPPRVAASPCALECRLLQIVDVKDLQGRPSTRYVVFGQVVGVHIDDRFIKDGRLDTAAMQPIARASRCLDIVAQCRGLSLHFVHAVLDHVADRDDADHLILLDDRNVAELARRHPLHDRADSLRLAACDDLARHHLRKRFREHVGALLTKRAHNVAFGKNSDHPTVRTEHEECANSMLGKRLYCGFERSCGLD
jgi:flavin reductase (DIM6/NTAB) family NADH-FMN oxidoreductase RutF